MGKGHRDPEKEYEMRRKGGVNSGKTRRLKKDMRTMCAVILESKPTISEHTQELMDELGIKGVGKEKNKYNVLTITLASLLYKAMAGDTRSIALVMELMGEDSRSRVSKEKIDFERELLENTDHYTHGNDGFMEAMNSVVEDDNLFGEKEDKPDHVE